MRRYGNWEKKNPETAKTLQRIKSAVRAVTPKADIVLYGSRARGDAGRSSDWDLLILVDPPLTNELTREIRDRLFDIELETDNIITSIIRTRKEWSSEHYAAIPFKQAVESEGIIL